MTAKKGYVTRTDGEWFALPRWSKLVVLRLQVDPSAGDAAAQGQGAATGVAGSQSDSGTEAGSMTDRQWALILIGAGSFLFGSCLPWLTLAAYWWWTGQLSP
jgi:hypothetical protein